MTVDENKVASFGTTVEEIANNMVNMTSEDVSTGMVCVSKDSPYGPKTQP